MLPEELPHRCNITRQDTIPDEYGADYEDPEAIYADEAAWIQPVSDREQKEFQRRDQMVTHKVYLSRNLSLKPGYVILPTTGPFAGAYLEVKSGNEATAGTGLLWRIMVEEVQPR